MDVKTMIPYAVAVTTLAITVVVAITVLGGFKGAGYATYNSSNTSQLLSYTEYVSNTTIELFINGLVIFGTFIGVIILAIVGKIIIGMFTKK